MTDDRNAGGVPPAPGSAAPPPLAPSPSSVQPAFQPVPTPAPYSPPAKGGPGLWPLFTFLAFAVGVGGTILTLWLTGELWNSSPGSYSSPGDASVTGNGTGSVTPVPSTQAPTPAPPAPAPATTGYPPTPDTLTGTWGPGCPGSNNDVIIFYDDGTAASDGETGTWQIDGNSVTLNNGSETLVLQWEMLSDGRARVRRSGTAQSRVISRCP